MFNYRAELEKKLRVRSIMFNHSHQFRSRYILDPLSLIICNSIPRYHKLEVYVLALTLLRYNDCRKISMHNFLNNTDQEIMQGKTKTIINIPPLFLAQSPLTAIEFPVVSLFSDSYDKLRYTLRNSIPTELRAHLDTQRSLTHIFRFLRTTYYYLTDKDYFKASKYLGHKDPESVKSYVPNSLLNYYSNHLSKG